MAAAGARVVGLDVDPVTLPKRALNALDALSVQPTRTHFALEVRDGSILLTPARIDSAGVTRRKLAELDITDADIDDAVPWARQHS